MLSWWCWKRVEQEKTSLLLDKRHGASDVCNFGKHSSLSDPCWETRRPSGEQSLWLSFCACHAPTTVYIYIDWRSDVAWLIDIRDFFCRYYTQIGHLKKGLNPPSLSDLAFGSPYLVTAIKTGAVTGIIALAVSPHHLSNQDTLIRQLDGRESTYVMLHLPRGFLDT